jgi:undecaprenyl diphosphate synthase
MMQSTFHVAIIMDGNGRWAAERGLPRTRGHQAGAAAVERTVEAARRHGITDLTLYAFSSDNWQRPQAEVDSLMRLLEKYLRRQRERCRESGVALRVIGRRDRLSPGLVAAIEAAERHTTSTSGMILRIAVDYSARWSLARAAGSSDIRSALALANHDASPMPDVDLLIRTGREQRLSDFLLWECSYAELRFSDTMWPDFTARELLRAVDDFRARNRRFGHVEEKKVAGATR